MTNLKVDQNGYVLETFPVMVTPEQGTAIAEILGLDADLVTQLVIKAGEAAEVTAAIRVEANND